MKAAIIGTGNIGSDLLIKMRSSEHIEPVAFVGIDPASDGLALAKRLGIATTADGIDGLTRLDAWDEIGVVFDATSAGAHARHNAVATAAGKRVIDLTPAAIGPYTVPVVNGARNAGELNINMVTCGGQATTPIVAAISSVASVPYAEIVSSVASRSAGPGTRANIDEFTETTGRALEIVGGAGKGKAIIILNPAEPPMIMRNTVFALAFGATQDAVAEAIHAMVQRVQAYVPGYRLKQDVQFEHSDALIQIPGYGEFEGFKVSVFLEVAGAAHYLPAYAGNLDIMTSAALEMGEQIALAHRGTAA